MKLNPYLEFDGDALAAITFYAEALNGTVAAVMTMDQIPDGTPIPEGAEGRLAHGRVVFGDYAIMVSDTFTSDQFKGHQGFTLQTDFDTPEAAHAAFARISEGGTIVMPIGETFWAKAFGVCKDKFGVGWMMNCEG